MNTNRYIVTVKSRFNFTYRPEVIGLYNIEEVSIAAEEYLTNKYNDFDGFGKDDIYKLINIFDNKDRSLIGFIAEFKVILDVNETEESSDMLEQLHEMFEDGWISYTEVFDEQLN